MDTNNIIPKQISDISENNNKVNMGAGVAFEGAARFSKSLATWRPPLSSADIDIIPEKDLLDARSLSIFRNDAYVSNAKKTTISNTVGDCYRLKAIPAYKTLGLSKEWALAFTEEVEEKFQLWANSNENYVDKLRSCNFTQLLKLAVSSYFLTGEVLAVADWDSSRKNYIKTCIQLIDPARLRDPYNKLSFTTKNRGGIEFDEKGVPIYYNIRNHHPYNAYYLSGADETYVRIPRKTSWGRQKVIHLFKHDRPEQTRGLSELVTCLKSLKVLSKLQDTTLQNMVVQATYAAFIKTDLPNYQAKEVLGAGITANNDMSLLEQQTTSWLGLHAKYFEDTGGIQIDGVKVPVLPPGTEVVMTSPDNKGGVIGADFEASVLKYIAAGLGVSYESLSKDYKRTSYSSARAGLLEMYKSMQTIKTDIVDVFAGHIYTLWLEEMIDRNLLRTVPRNFPNFYEGLNKDAYCRAEWIGPARGQIEELKEDQAASLRINSGLSSITREAAARGVDINNLLEEIAEERAKMEELGLTFLTQNNMMNSVQGKASEVDAREPDDVEKETDSQED